jgi:hypothetical protein
MKDGLMPDGRVVNLKDVSDSRGQSVACFGDVAGAGGQVLKLYQGIGANMKITHGDHSWHIDI